jgi:hypothetical protein
MSNIKAPKADRIGNDFHEGPNPGPGGEIDTGDSLVPPYDGRTRGRKETPEGPEITMSGEAPPGEASQPESGAGHREDARTTPEGVGETETRAGERR